MSSDPDDKYSFDPRYDVPVGCDKIINEDIPNVLYQGMRNRGQTVKLTPKADIIAEHKSKSASNKPGVGESFFVHFKYEPPCSAPLSSLRRIFVKDLKLAWDYRDAVVVLRTLVPPRGSVTPYRRWWRTNKAPAFTFDSMGTAIVVNYLTDFVRLAQGGILYPVKWNQSVPPSAPSASEWFKDEGNNAYKSQKYQTAVVRGVTLSYFQYTEALHFKPDESLKLAIYSNRAQAHLASGAFEAAIADSTFVLSHELQHEKALYRCARGHYAMQNYAAAHVLLTLLIQACPSNETANSDLQRVAQRVQEQTTGAYDFAEMLKVSCGPCPQMDVADYIGPVKQRAEGLFATRDISAGELLLCTKAFEFVYANNSDRGVFFNNKTHCVTGASTLRLSKKFAQKMALNPSYISSFRELHRYSPTISGNISDKLIDGRPVIDKYLIESIMNPQVFAMRCPHGAQHKYGGIGLSLTPSYIRHDCLGNCTRAVIGDVVIYRASTDIKIGAEILVPYVSPSMPVEKRQELLQCYDIHCNCRLCQSQQDDKKNHKQRLDAAFGTLLTPEDMFQNPLKAARRLEELCTRLERTYVDHPTIQPRFYSVGKLALLGTCYHILGNKEKLLETSLRGLSAMGFDAKVDATGNLQIMRHGHYDRENVFKFAVMQSSTLKTDGFVTQAASWKALVRTALNIHKGHWSFSDDLIFGSMHNVDLSESD
ncbi:hypothetical protein BD410DRAFT_883165 [Rickenella mellea]|uniref:SET domain-containing protein n=1 Tax=Rickenella mellea TaxID=50990 RepID=A0A4Y7PRU1_9AGAM|nr:hypothetical protein BD410DRAFT_883165 [Rickenella mellea]